MKWDDGWMKSTEPNEAVHHDQNYSSKTSLYIYSNVHKYGKQMKIQIWISVLFLSKLFIIVIVFY